MILALLGWAYASEVPSEPLEPPSRRARGHGAFSIGNGLITDDLYFRDLVFVQWGVVWSPTPMAELGMEGAGYLRSGIGASRTWGWERVNAEDVSDLGATVLASVRIHLFEQRLSDIWWASLGLRGGGGVALIDDAAWTEAGNDGYFPLFSGGGFVQIRRNRMELRLGVDRLSWVQTTSTNPDARFETQLRLDTLWWVW